MKEFNDSNIILEVKGLQTYFKTDAGIVKAVDGVSFDVQSFDCLIHIGFSKIFKKVKNDQ